MGRTDAIIRLVLGAVLIVLALMFEAHFFISLVAALGAIGMIGSAITGECPFYALFGCSTLPRTSPRSAETPRQ